MSINLGDSTLNDATQVYVLAYRDLSGLEERYLLECGVENFASFYTKFGWKTLSADFPGDPAYFPQGHYAFQLYWAVDSDFDNVINSVDAKYYRLGTNLPEFHVVDNKNGSIQDAVTLKETKYSHGDKDVEFVTSFNGGTRFTGFVYQCNFSSTYFNNSCKIDYNSTFNFTTKEDGTQKITVTFSDYLENTKKGEENETVTYMNVTTIKCDDETRLTTQIELEIGKSSGGNNGGLSAGAIVGIVCAGVLVLGLAAWWLCMKKSGGDGYRELNE